jgi:hypothetical protein
MKKPKGRYGCPHCKTTDQVIELAWVSISYEGVFDSSGAWEGYDDGEVQWDIMKYDKARYACQNGLCPSKGEPWNKPAYLGPEEPLDN